MSKAAVERVSSLISLLGVEELQLEVLNDGIGRSGDSHEENNREGVTQKHYIWEIHPR